MTRLLQFVSSVALVALIFLCLAWELWLAPLRAGGFGVDGRACDTLCKGHLSASPAHPQGRNARNMGVDWWWAEGEAH